jgi:hypothetical protein
MSGRRGITRTGSFIESSGNPLSIAPDDPSANPLETVQLKVESLKDAKPISTIQLSAMISLLSTTEYVFYLFVFFCRSSSSIDILFPYAGIMRRD